MTYCIQSRRSQGPRFDRGMTIHLRNQARASGQTMANLISVLRDETKHRVCDLSFWELSGV
jgi:hypothetical protein